jgi:hypothetical protein
VASAPRGRAPTAAARGGERASCPHPHDRGGRWQVRLDRARTPTAAAPLGRSDGPSGAWLRHS